MKKNVLYITIILACMLLSIGALVYKKHHQDETDMRLTSTQAESNRDSTNTLEVATDPSFPEYEGEIVEGFPSFPVYPDAELKASAKLNKAGEPDLGYRVLWTTTDDVPKVMRWYEAELRSEGWELSKNDDPNSQGEQVLHIENTLNGTEYKGYIAAEMEGDKIEIIAELRLD